MSTNFYFKADAPHPLSVFGELHIGKRSGGWSFSFQAYDFEGSPARHAYQEVPDSTLSIRVLLPELPAVQLKSWQDWKALLLSGAGRVLSEYGVVEPTEAFIREVENDLHPTKGRWGSQNKPLLNSFDESKRFPEFSSSDKAWKDAEGYSFTLRIFS